LMPQYGPILGGAAVYDRGLGMYDPSNAQAVQEGKGKGGAKVGATGKGGAAG
jgi:hypothetical protein